MSSSGAAPSPTVRPVVVAHLAATKTIKGKVMDAEFPIRLKERTEVLAQRQGPNQFLVVAPYGETSAECILGRADLIFPRA